MGGHSHWANIKHKKGATDAKRGKAWTKLSREISIAAKLGGGGDPDSNPRLRAAIVDARELQMPSDTIARAIKRGIGDTEGATFEELTYEGYAAGGVAMIIDCTSDNRNRTRSEIHTVMAKNGGALGAPNSVAWSFKTRGLIVVKNISSMAHASGACSAMTASSSEWIAFKRKGSMTPGKVRITPEATRRGEAEAPSMTAQPVSCSPGSTPNTRVKRRSAPLAFLS